MAIAGDSSRAVAASEADVLQTPGLLPGTGRGGTDTALGMAARAVALVSDGPAADAAYQVAIDHLQRSPFAVYLPRAHLVYGESLRRAETPRRGARATASRSQHVRADARRWLCQPSPSRIEGDR